MPYPAMKETPNTLYHQLNVFKKKGVPAVTIIEEGYKTW